jgi:hypothetical protein
MPLCRCAVVPVCLWVQAHVAKLVQENETLRGGASESAVLASEVTSLQQSIAVLQGKVNTMKTQGEAAAAAAADTSVALATTQASLADAVAALDAANAG